MYFLVFSEIRLVQVFDLFTLFFMVFEKSLVNRGILDGSYWRLSLALISELLDYLVWQENISVEVLPPFLVLLNELPRKVLISSIEVSFLFYLLCGFHLWCEVIVSFHLRRVVI